MLSEFKEYFSQFTFLGPKDMADLVSISKLVRYKKGETIVSAGELSNYLNVVLTGFVRVFIVREDGEERTVYLPGQGMGFGSSKTVFAGLPSNETSVALEDCLILTLDMTEGRKKADRNPNLYRVYSMALEKSILEAVERIEYHTVLNPDQRYEYLLKNRPEIFERVPLKHIASYIGITPVSLSGLRARLARPK